MASRLPATGRMVLVDGKSITYAYRSLTRIMTRTGLQRKLFQRRFYEKPTKKRERLEYEKCFRIYNREMKKKIAFVMKQHDPLPPI